MFFYSLTKHKDDRAEKQAFSVSKRNLIISLSNCVKQLICRCVNVNMTAGTILCVDERRDKEKCSVGICLPCECAHQCGCKF